MIAAYERGDTFGDIAARFRVSTASVQRVIRDAGVEPRRPGRHRALDGREQDALDLYNTGLSYSEVAEMLGVTESIVGRAIRSLGGARRQRGRSAVVGREDAIVVAYRAGATAKALAAEHHVSHDTIRSVLRARGVTIRPGGRRRS